MNIKKWVLPLFLTMAGTFVFAQNGGEPDTPVYGNVFIYEDAVPGAGGEPEAGRVINAYAAEATGEGGEPALDLEKIKSIRLEDGMTEEVQDGITYFFVLPQRYHGIALEVENTSIGEDARFSFSKQKVENDVFLVITTKQAQGAYITVYEGQNYKREDGLQFVGSLDGEGRNLLLLKLE